MELPVLAYFITFHTYGSWLHGAERGSVDDQHNEYGTPFIVSDPQRLEKNRERMTQAMYLMDQPRREVVCDAIIAECRFRGWHLHALHVRSNHVHLVVTADTHPDFVMKSCKAHASKCLNRLGFDSPDHKRWSVHGSTRYLWSEDSVMKKFNTHSIIKVSLWPTFRGKIVLLMISKRFLTEPERQRRPSNCLRWV